jgi:prolyl-tRNA editing enzyme YbaK/EbsC (Cys-tRNA(Pro) deacylase)
MPETLSPSAQRFQDVLRARGFANQVEELPATTRTSAEAAQAIGCQLAQIAKSVVFKGKHTQKPILVIASGANRVNEKKMAELVAEPIEKPDADYVRQRTGFVIGGVAPVGHAEPLDIYIDEDLLNFERIWAAAGTPHAIFGLTPEELVRMTGGRVVSVK